MRILFTSFIILFSLSSLSFGEVSNVDILEKKFLPNEVLINRICVGGYEFILVCTYYGGLCDDNVDQNSPKYSYQLQQIITEEGGGKKC